MTPLCMALVSQLGGGQTGEGRQGAPETGAEIMLVRAPWGARQGQNRPLPEKAGADPGGAQGLV